MPTRSQRHLREIEGVNSGGAGPALPPVNTTPSVVGLPAAGAVGRTIMEVTMLNGMPPFTYVVTTAAGVAAAFSPAGSNVLKTTADPAGTTGGHAMSLTVTDALNRAVVVPLAVTLT